MTTVGMAVLAALLARGQSVRPAGRIVGEGMGCATLTQRELNFRGAHAMVCYEGFTGEVIGAYLKRNGKILCQVHGTYDGTCLVFTACGRVESGCG